MKKLVIHRTIIFVTIHSRKHSFSENNFFIECVSSKRPFKLSDESAKSEKIFHTPPDIAHCLIQLYETLERLL